MPRQPAGERERKGALVSDPSRRGFLGVAAAALGGVLIAPGVRLIEVAQASTPAAAGGAKPAVRWGLLIDTTLCVSGCSDCVTACNTENGLADGEGDATRPQWIRKVEIKEIRSGRSASLPVMCQHCAEPPCVDVCPTGASFKRADGIVLVDRHACIGCRYCLMACPYKARSFVHQPLTDQRPDVPRGQGCAEGCTLCVHRIDRGQKNTACAEACTRGAILFGDLNDPASEIARRVQTLRTTALRADLALDPGVRYQGI
ncbi:MAG: 4Fe-4S dicluster domain-containing protein [Burkholderiales bacterium]|nr:4Fe-4S dicluster domain-containing protein [Burkholderiales bacterium]MDE1926839.1 4Fe-4S dicluster domain-containing protein [Burkholderiales bacterium]MDE2157570.1 4Fe-4S dicluster domain-containing protein [Burkholderiales bacterium]MDE2503885.1 4Fe-4S dicluster domain-containing protein [Burkholderiales bacterium]